MCQGSNEFRRLRAGLRVRSGPERRPRLGLFELEGQFEQAGIFAMRRREHHADGQTRRGFRKWQRDGRFARRVLQGREGDPVDESVDDLLIVRGGVEVTDTWGDVGQRRREEDVIARRHARRDALDAGEVWWDADLFAGDPDFSKLLAVKAPEPTAEEREFLEGPTAELCALLDDWKIYQGQVRRLW